MSQPDSILSILKRVYRLLNPHERKRSVLLLLSIFANSIVEILGLAVIVPVIGLVVQPETIQTNPTLLAAYNAASAIGIDTPSRFLIALCFLMIAAFLFKALFSLAVSFFQTRFSFSVALRLSAQMWNYHFSQSLERMRGKDSGEIIAEINAWPLLFAHYFMVGGLMLLTEINVIALIASGLLLYNPLVFLGVSGLISSGGLMIRWFTKRRLQEYSEIQKKTEPQTYTLITNAVRGFLEIVTFRASNSTRNAYLKERGVMFRIKSTSYILSLAPAKLYEVLAVVAIAGAIIIALLQGTPDESFLQLLSLLAISAYRVLPSMNRLNGAAMHMRGQKFVLDTMEQSAESFTFTDVLESTVDKSTSIDIRLDNIALSYSTLTNPVIENVNHHFETGKLHGIVGPSGSGKSTLISALLGLHVPEKGEVLVRKIGTEVQRVGKDIELHKWIENVGYLSQHPFLFKGTVRENLTLRVSSTTINEPLVAQLLKTLHLEECLGPSPLDFRLKEGGSNLSGGQQQRLALLRALQIQRPVLILDEATSALDHKLRDVVFQQLKLRAESGCNVILVTHDLDLAKQCDTLLDLTTH